MIQLSASARFVLGVKPQDFRKGIDGLVSQVKHCLGSEPQSGDTFVFINRSKTMMRFLSYDGTGYWLMTKRLSAGRFKWWPADDASAISDATAKEISAMIKGANPHETSTRGTTENQPAKKPLPYQQTHIPSSSGFSRGNRIGTSCTGHRHC